MKRTGILFLLLAVLQTPWIETKRAHYSIFSQPGFEKDVEFVRMWMDRAEALMRSKYGVTPDRYRISFYLHPAPTEHADVGRALNRCCTPDAKGIGIGTIDYLAPSAPAMLAAATARSSLGMPKNDPNYHAKVIISEYIPIGHYAVQDARPSGGWEYYKAPEWFVQGLQEYDAIFHTTETNRTVTAARLLEWAKRNSATFACCDAGLAIGDVYNGGATFMAFLSAEFGEDVHVRLLRSGAPTFEAALADATKPRTLQELFNRFQAWLNAR